MKRNYAILLASLFMAGACCSCSEKGEVTAAGDNNVPGDYIDFTVGELGSRTVRDENDKYQLLWEEGDSVRIYCEQASTDEGLHYADYAVIPDASDARKGKLAFNPHGLRWNEKKITHKFYAVCPDSTAIAFEDGVVSVRMYPDIYGYLTDDDSVCTSNVKDFMVASCDATNNSAVSLKFKPLVTTLCLTFTNTTDSPYDFFTYIDFVWDNLTYTFVEDEYFPICYYKYDFSTGEVSGELTSEHLDLIGSLYGANGEWIEYISLAPGKSLKWMLSLPYYPIDADHPIKIGFGEERSYGSIVLDGKTTQEGHVLGCKAGELLSVTINLNK